MPASDVHISFRAAEQGAGSKSGRLNAYTLLRLGIVGVLCVFRRCAHTSAGKWQRHRRCSGMWRNSMRARWCRCRLGDSF
ncbi:hypothetical protein F2P81_015884 [Scophthalmus maximus]|uniref:Uncharacterized protein n=1 Tax=Scophthalmus maximus TaxID=52904 RepID=A0A6A4SFR5_SCOMX|nr:hypothetical protein F2P81_015884 [Scophthalmus maximus]